MMRLPDQGDEGGSGGREGAVVRMLMILAMIAANNYCRVFYMEHFSMCS